MGRPLTNWIKLFDGVHENVKTIRFARRMEWNVYEAVGRLTRFWVYLSRHRPHGDIDQFNDEELAMLFDADCCGTQLRDALIETRLVSKSGRRGYCVNDWDQMTGRRFRELERSTQRSAARARKRAEADASRASETSQATEKDCETEQVSAGESSSSLFSSSLFCSDSEGIDKGNKKRTRRTLRRATWESYFGKRFWPEYPRKVAKGKAEIVWERLGNRHAYAMTAEDLCDNVVLLLRWYIKREWKGRPDNGTDFPHAATWINSERFDDERIKEVMS